METSPGRLNLYFDYGRSTEAKILRQIGPTYEQSAPIAQAGWFESRRWEEQPVRPAAGAARLIAIYGMSFSNHVGEAMQDLDSSVTVRYIPGPGAPPNHSYTAFQRDRQNHEAEVVIFGILASSLVGLEANSSMNWGSEFPAPYTFPKYTLQDGELQATPPTIQSLSELRRAVDQGQPWETFVQEMAEQDRFYHPFLFRHNALDRSALVRLARRAWTQRHKQLVTQKIHTSDGFDSDWEQIPVLQQMVRNFAHDARKDGRLPIVLLLNNQGYADHLAQILEPTLTQAAIPFISTHTIVPASDRHHFANDGHFTQAANRKIATQVLQLIHTNLSKS